MSHSGVLKLLERPTGVDSLVLAGVADQDYPIVRTKTIEELACLLCADEARFVDHVEVSAPSSARPARPGDAEASSTEIPASSSWDVARDVGARPWTLYPSRCAAILISRRVVVLPDPATP